MTDPRISAAKADLVVEAYKRVRKKEISYIDSTRKEKQHEWILSLDNVFKINADAAISSKNQRVGLDALIKDSNGKVVAFGINQSSLNDTISFAEAEAVQWGFHLARASALTSLIIETYI